MADFCQAGLHDWLMLRSYGVVGEKVAETINHLQNPDQIWEHPYTPETHGLFYACNLSSQNGLVHKLRFCVVDRGRGHDLSKPFDANYAICLLLPRIWFHACLAVLAFFTGPNYDRMCKFTEEDF